MKEKALHRGWSGVCAVTLQTVPGGSAQAGDSYWLFEMKPGGRLLLKSLMDPHCSYVAAWRAGLKTRSYSRSSTTFRPNAASSTKVHPPSLHVSSKTGELWLCLSPLDQPSSRLSGGSCDRGLPSALSPPCVHAGAQRSPFSLLHVCVGKAASFVRDKEPKAFSQWLKHSFLPNRSPPCGNFQHVSVL